MQVMVLLLSSGMVDSPSPQHRAHHLNAPLPSSFHPPIPRLPLPQARRSGTLGPARFFTPFAYLSQNIGVGPALTGLWLPAFLWRCVRGRTRRASVCAQRRRACLREVCLAAFELLFAAAVLNCRRERERGKTKRLITAFRPLLASCPPPPSTTHAPAAAPQTAASALLLARTAPPPPPQAPPVSAAPAALPVNPPRRRRRRRRRLAGGRTEPDRAMRDRRGGCRPRTLRSRVRTHVGLRGCTQLKQKCRSLCCC